MIVLLTLGGVIFEDFEIPSVIRAGGSQQLDIKKFLGGTRIIDAMGRDEDPIEWIGRFRGSTAESRCQQLNAMRIAGLPVQLTWSTFNYLVVIDRFTFDYESPLEIPYKIALTVLVDQTIPIPTLAQTIDEVFGTNLATAGNLAAEANVAGVTTSLNQVQTAASTIQTLSGSNLNGLSQSIVAAQGVTATAIGVASGQITPVAGSVLGATAGLPPQTIAANVAGQASALGQLGSLLPLGDVLTVMSKNISSIGP
ncbi:MAG: hypothetical protein WAL34_04035 [Acidobacteriaceae bacterium]